MSTTDISRSLKEGLQQRGTIDVPLMPQLSPVLTFDVHDLGAAPGIPVGFSATQSAVAAQRSGSYLSAPAGYVLRIDWIYANAAAVIAIGPISPFTAPNQNYIVLDWRRSQDGAVPGKVRGYGLHAQAAAAWQADSFELQIIGAAATYEGPLWVTSTGAIYVFGSADNVAIRTAMRGVIFEGA